MLMINFIAPVYKIMPVSFIKKTYIIPIPGMPPPILLPATKPRADYFYVAKELNDCTKSCFFIVNYDIIFLDMPKNTFSREELTDLYSKWNISIQRDQKELKARHFDENGNVLDVNDPNLNMFAGKIAGKTELALDFIAFLEFEPAPDTIENLDFK